MGGTLYVVATPIGNLEDITLRALRVLREAAWIACEDTRRTRHLLAGHALRGRLLSYHKFNERARTPRLLRALASGEDVALVSDGGTPALSDPGAILVAAAADAGIRVTPVPGPSALAAAVSVSGLAAGQVTFSGFLPRRFAHRLRLFSALEEVPGVLVFYESPRRAAASLAEMAARWGGRRAVLAREITKVHEEFLRGTLRELAERVGSGPLRGEVTLIVEGAAEEGGAAAGRKRTAGKTSRPSQPEGQGRPLQADAAAHDVAEPRELARLRREVNRRLQTGGGGRSAAVRAVARERGIDPRALYRALARTAPGADDTESEE